MLGIVGFHSIGNDEIVESFIQCGLLLMDFRFIEQFKKHGYKNNARTALLLPQNEVWMVAFRLS